MTEAGERGNQGEVAEVAPACEDKKKIKFPYKTVMLGVFTIGVIVWSIPSLRKLSMPVAVKPEENLLQKLKLIISLGTERLSKIC